MENRKCTNCRYFIQYYTKYNDKLRAIVGNGFCCNDNVLKKDSKKLIAKDGCCELWEPMEIQIKEREERIKGSLNKIVGKLQDIILMLKDGQ